MNSYKAKKQQTVDAYNRGAKQLAVKFNKLDRVPDINEALGLTNKSNPRVLEIGCGNGRDAEEIVKRTNDYLGIDISKEMIELAKKRVPSARFEVADMEIFEFPKNLDIIFAFASLLHSPKEILKDILSKAHSSLNAGGVVYLSLKYKDSYEEFEKQDDFGKRVFYFYSKNDIEEIAGNFTVIKNEVCELRGVQWLEVMLRKV